MLCVHNIIPVQLSSQLAAVQLYYQSKLLSSLDQNKKNQVFIYNFCTFTFTCLDFNFQRRQMVSATPSTHHVQPMGPLIHIGPLLTGNPRSQAGPTVQTRPSMFAHAAIFSSTSVLPRLQIDGLYGHDAKASHVGGRGDKWAGPGPVGPCAF